MSIPNAFSSLGVALLAVSSSAAAEPTEVLTVEKAVDLKSVRSVAIGPRGEWAAYELSVPRSADEEPGGVHTEVWVRKLDGESESRRFTPPGVDSRAPAWSPDGKSLAFLSMRAETESLAYFSKPDAGDMPAQIFVAPIDGGEARALTKHESSVRSFAFSPDGKRIAFVAREAKDPEREAWKELGHDWTVVGEVHDCDHLWVLDFESGEVEQLTGGNTHVTSFVWAPDGVTLFFHACRSPEVDVEMMYSRLKRVRTTGGFVETIFETEGKLGDLEVSPDGSTLAFLGATDIHDPLAQTVFLGTIASGRIRQLGVGQPFPEQQPFGEWALGASVSELTWVDDGQLLIGATRGTRSVLHVVDVADGEHREVVRGGRIRSLDLHRASGRFVATADSPDHPSELALGSIQDVTLRRLTDSNPGLAGCQLARQEVIEWRAEDGERIAGVLTWPVPVSPATEAPYPLIVNPHGGPEGADRLGWDVIAQLFAARGYAVLQPNYRGSSGRGVAWSKADHHDLGGEEFGDVLAGVDAVIERGIADPDRVGIGGWSYGGYFSALGATHHSERFRAAMMGAGISNWISFLGTTDIPHENYLVHWERWLPGNDELFWERSPLSAIERANTPTLILHGAGDTRVPPSQAMELYRALKDKGVETQLVLYPRAGHGVRERAHRIDLYTRQLEWFDRFLK